MGAQLYTISYRNNDGVHGQYLLGVFASLADAERYREENPVWDVGYNQEVQLSNFEIRATLFQEFIDLGICNRREAIVAIAYFCALEAIANGAPPIPEDTRYSAWKQGKAPFDGDFDFLRECFPDATQEEIAYFETHYLDALFSESPSC